MIERYRAKAGLSFLGKRGLHSFRHTLAMRLLKENQTLETIGGVLGHVKQDTTRQYLRIDLDGLRQVGLDPDEETTHA